MKHTMNSVPSRTVLLYLLFGSLWILLSDRLLFLIIPMPQEAAEIQTLKGWFFILSSGGLLYILLVRELGARRLAENARRVSEMRLTNIVESAMDGIIIIDSAQRIIQVNPAAARMFGYEEMKLLHQPLEMLLPASLREIHRRHVEQFGQTGKTRRSSKMLGNIMGLHANGTEFPIEASISLTEIDGQQIYTVIHRDITERKRAEAEIVSLAKFPAENPSPVLRVTGDGILLYANLSSAPLLTLWNTTVGSQLPDPLREVISEVLQLGQAKEIEIDCNGTIFSMIFEPVRETGYINGYGRDITGHKQAEHDLRMSEERFRLLFEDNHAMMMLIEPVTGTIRNANKAAERFYGYSHAELCSMNINEINQLSPDEIYAERMKALHEERNYFNFQHRLSNGEVRSVEVHSAPMEVEGETLLFSLIHDMTEQKQAEDFIRYQANLLENVSDAIIACDLNSNITSWNSAAQEIYGWSAEEILGKPVNAFLHTQYADNQTEEQVIQEFMAQGVWKGEVTQQRKDGRRLTLLASVSLVRDTSNSPAAMVAVYRDITLRKQAEQELRVFNEELEQRVIERTEELRQANRELERANRAKDEFLANMSHELRTPLNSILGFSETLLEQRRGPLNQKQVESIEWISSSGRHLLGLINDILDVSKIAAGKLQLYPDITYIKEVCESSLNFVREMAFKKSITLGFKPDPSVTAIRVDSQRFKQVLVNLLSNAIKFTPQGGKVSLEVVVTPQRDCIRFVVEDTGIGIAANDMPRLFTPFMQVDSRLSRQYSGTGLGLVLVFKYTEMHGGSVHVESEPGKGSRFTINLPLTSDGPAPKEDISLDKIRFENVLAKKEIAGTESLHEHKTILLAEDNEASILMVRDYLENLGYPIVIAHDGFEAVEKAEVTHPDVILMDIQMPVMDGLEAIGVLRKNPRFASTPIIALTALAMPGDRERCLQAGANEYMSKPISLKLLQKTIETMLLEKGDV